jgi:hypothetical protein
MHILEISITYCCFFFHGNPGYVKALRLLEHALPGSLIMQATVDSMFIGYVSEMSVCRVRKLVLKK